MTQSLEEALRNPTPTADKRIRAFTERMKALPRKQAAPSVVPGLDIPALNAKYGAETAHHPRPMLATFRVPIGCTPAHLHDLKRAAFVKLVQVLDAQGWEPIVDGQHVPQDAPGVYPARDLADNTPLLDQREWLLRVWFWFRNPQPLTIELDAVDVAPTPLTAA